MKATPGQAEQLTLRDAMGDLADILKRADHAVRNPVQCRHLLEALAFRALRANSESAQAFVQAAREQDAEQGNG